MEIEVHLGATGLTLESRVTARSPVSWPRFCSRWCLGGPHCDSICWTNPAGKAVWPYPGKAPQRSSQFRTQPQPQNISPLSCLEAMRKQRCSSDGLDGSNEKRREREKANSENLKLGFKTNLHDLHLYQIKPSEISSKIKNFPLIVLGDQRLASLPNKMFSWFRYTKRC